MSFVNDRLYNTYLRQKMPLLASNVRTREIMPHLPCLTQSDREEIEAKRETCGNYNAMQTLLDCLRKRQNWPEEFISALEACEHTIIAAEVRAQYNSLRAPNNPNPSSPPTTVVTAHVHPAPPAAHPVATPERDGNTPATPAPPEPVPQASPPPEPAPSPPAEAPKAVSTSEPVPQPPQSPQTKEATPPSTPPPSPEPAHRQAVTPPPPQRGINTQQEPEENSEMDLQQVSSGQDPIPGKAEGKVLVVNSEAAPEPRRPVEQVERAAPSLPHPVQTGTMEDRALQSPPPAQTTPTKTDGSAYRMSTPEKPPVQETVPLVNKVATAVLQPEETSEPTATQVVQNSQQTRTTDTPRPPNGIDGMAASLRDDENDVCLSKPGQLISMQQNIDRPTIPAPNAQQGPYSGDSGRLQISESLPPRQENGVVAESPQHNEPEENHYESICQSSLGEQAVHVVHVAEEPSIQNQDGQTFRPPAQILNGKATTEPDSAPPPNTADSVSNLNAPSGENCHLSGSAPHDAEVNMPPTSASLNRKYYITAAGVGVCALLMAWKFKK